MEEKIDVPKIVHYYELYFVKCCRKGT